MALAWSRKTLGCCFILATAAIWIITSFISESLVSSSDSKPSQVHPFLLTYLATSLFTLYLPALAIKAWLSQGKRQREDEVQIGEVKHGRSNVERNDMFSSQAARTTMMAACWVTPVWVLAQYTFNTSLAYTSVTSNTILSSTSSLFAFFLSIIVLGEKFSTSKLLAIAACIAGTALVTYSDNQSDSESGSEGAGSLQGDALAVLSACLYGCYTVIMRKKLPGEDGEARVALFFGFVGLFSTVALAPVIILLSARGVFSLASIPMEVYLIVILEGLLDYVLADYLWARAVMLIGPTVATLGMSCQIPMAASVELLAGRATWIHSSKTIVMTLAGTVLILSGLFTVNLSLKSDEGPKQQILKSRSSDTEDDQEEAAGLLGTVPTVGRAEEDRDKAVVGQQ